MVDPPSNITLAEIPLPGIVTSLANELGLPLVLYRGGRSRSWRPWHARYEDTLSQRYGEYLQRVCIAAATGNEPQFAAVGDRGLLAIPCEHDTICRGVAVAEIPTTGAAGMLRTAKLLSRLLVAETQIDKLQDENALFAEQLSSDLEELSFLRTLASQLDVSDPGQTFLSLGERLLPELNASVSSATMTLLAIYDESEPLFATPIVTVGKRRSDLLLSRIVQWFGEVARNQPVVKNSLRQAPEGALMPGIDSFVLVPVMASAKPMGWLVAIDRLPNAASGALGADRNEFGTSEASLMSTTASMLATHARNVELFREKEELLIRVVRAFVSAIEAKDDYTRGHSERVALYARCIAPLVGYSEEEIERLYLTGLVHDLGKIGVSDAVLKKRDRLTDEEFEEIKRHPDEGWAILLEIEQLRYVLPGVLHHHERADGRGYPDGLHGSAIHRDAQVLAVADAYDAMTSDRPYRRGMPPEVAQQRLREGAGTQWSAEMVEAFFAALDEIERVRHGYRPRVRPVRLRGTLGVDAFFGSGNL